jgi:type IV secretion system protein VirD4
MSRTTRNLIGLGIALFALAGLSAFGLFAGGRVFAQLQHVPVDTVSLATLHDYWVSYGTIKKVKLALIAGWAVAILTPGVPVGLVLVGLLSGAKRELFGNARFATMFEVRRAGLLGDENARWPAFVLGKKNGRFLFFSGQQFVALRAPTRNYKGVGCVIPNLLTYQHSVVCTDIKLENWTITAGFRARHGQECYLFAPTNADLRSHRWNMLSYIRSEYEFRIGDVQSIAAMWWPTGGKNAFFDDNARTLFLGLTLYLLETPGEPLTMANLLRLTTPADGAGLHEWIEATIKKREEPNQVLHRLSPECVDALRTYSKQPDKTRSNILSTLQAPLDIFRDPRIAAATSGNDFDLRQVRRKKMSIYLGMTAEDLMKYSTLMNVFFSQLINENTRTLPEHDPSLKYQCALIGDEFPALGRIQIIPKAIAYMAAYNMRLLLIYQNKGQLIGNELLGTGYGDKGAETILTNCAVNLMYQPKNHDDAKEYSEVLGFETVKSRSVSRTAGKAGLNSSDSPHQRALMLPQELKEMGVDKLIVSMENCKPIFADKIMYFKDPEFKDRAGLPPPEVPRLQIAVVQHRTRPLTQDEVATVAADDILNKAEILKAIGEAIGFDFASYIVPATPANVDVKLAEAA